MLTSSKLKAMLALAAFFCVAMLILVPLINIIGGANLQAEIENRFLDLNYLAASVAVFLTIGLVIGYFNAKYSRKH